MSSNPVLHLYQVPSKYSKRYLNYRADTQSLSNKTKGDNSKNKKARVIILVCDMLSHPVLHFYHQNIPKGIQVTEQILNLFQTKQREITPKVRKQELSFL